MNVGDDSLKKAAQSARENIKEQINQAYDLEKKGLSLVNLFSMDVRIELIACDEIFISTS